MSRSRIFILATCIIVASVVSGLKVSRLKVAQEKLLTIISPALYASAIVKKNIDQWFHERMTVQQLEEANEKLLLENKKLIAENLVLHDAQKKNNQLRRVLAYQEESAFQLMPATIIARDNFTWWNSVKIDRGSRDGIAPDMAVITESGLVGKIGIVTPIVSTIILITDENCHVAAKIEGTVEQGICNGLRIPTGELQLNFLNKLANLQNGQKVYTAGVSGGIFPSGIAIGTVKNFQLRELDGQAIIEPTVDFNDLEHVFVVVGGK